jgi:hypothetical protein
MGRVTHFIPPIASANMIRFSFAACCHSPLGIAAGVVLVLAAWSYGLLLRS